MSYDFQAIEQRWQAYWAEHQTFRTPNPGDPDFDEDKPKYYVLDMFPYPSGVGLHVGHPLGYIATDIVARYRRMRGYNVLHPMGYDAFGLPAEQFAVEHGVHPRETTEKNIANMTRQLKRLGLSYDWHRELATTDIDYYKWTQWIFLRLYHSYVNPHTGKARPISELVHGLETESYYLGIDDRLVPAEVEGLDGIEGPPAGTRKWHELDVDEQRRVLDGYRLAYLDEVPVNWCPALGTVLANEEVTNDGRSERGNHPVFKRPLKQWMLRITAFAERLVDDLDVVDWPEPIRIMQRNWIGRSQGARVDFPLLDQDDKPTGDVITVFTTRPDTLFGATYMVLAPEHPLVPSITTREQYHAVNEYRRQAEAKADVDRQAEAREKTGVFTGAYAINPVTDKPVPIWIADYVLMGYGTGAIMAVPAHDERDFDFALTFDLPIVDVVYPPVLAAIKAFCDRYADSEPLDADAAESKLADFVGLCMNQGRDDYDEVWRLVSQRRTPSPDSGKPGISARGSISNIWRDALPTSFANDVAGVCRVFREAGVIKAQGQAFSDVGISVNSTNETVSLDGLPTDEAKRRITDWLDEQGLGRGQVQYKLRDWLFSRQRYWGEPFPILHGPDGEIRAVPEDQLPVKLPPMEDFTPHASDDPDAAVQTPLSRVPEEWRYVTIDGTVYERELNTMPQWAGSCWYYLRFLDPKNNDRFADPDVERYWMRPGAKGEERERLGQAPMGVDLYVGGAEHAVLHLLYARFWHKVLFDLGHVSTPEPFGRLFNQGYIQAHAYTDERGIYVDAEKVEEREGRFFHGDKPVTQEFGKMGKSLKNAIAPDEIAEQYGCDTLRLYEMYLGPLDQSKVWRTRDIVGVHRFLQRLWRNFVDDEENLLVSDDAPSDALRRKLHETIRKVGEDMEKLSFNTAIAALIELNNELVQLPTLSREVAETMTLLLAPIAPHVAEELWSRLGHKDSLAYEPWPTHDPSLLVQQEVEYPVQINGKVKGRVTVPADAGDEEIEMIALGDEKVQAAIAGKDVKKVIVVKGRLLNIVVG